MRVATRVKWSYTINSMGNKTSKLFFFLILAVMVVGANAFIWNNFKGSQPLKVKTAAKPTPAIVSKQPSASSDLERVLAARVADETSLIKLAVFDKSGLDDVTAEWTILNKDISQASGKIRQRSNNKELFWRATKTGESWTCIYVGPEQPK